MGSLASRLIAESEDFELVASISSAGSLDEMVGADIVFDVTVPAVSQSVVEFAVDHGIAAVVGTSGWSSDRIASIQSRLGAEPKSGVIFVPNFSVGSVLASSFAALASRFFDSIEIVEAHHEGKVDSPSGTAVRTAELMGAARAGRGPVLAPHVDQRARGQQVSSIPIHSLRIRGVVAKQDVVFGGTGEVLEISHTTFAATSYEAGILLALRAAVANRAVLVGLDKLIDLDFDAPAGG